MTNLKQSFEDAAARVEDKLLQAVIGWHDDDDKKYSDYRREFPVESWETASQKINYEYDNGFGSAGCHAVIAWGEKFVYFIDEYDGATSISYAPRDPEPCAPSWSGIEK